MIPADLYHFFRVSALGATLTLPLQGAASVECSLERRRLLGLLAVAAAFHGFAYVHNDVCDLELDRTQPRRAAYPLVQGRIAPRAALAVALACVPLAFTLDRLLVASAHSGKPVVRRGYLAAAFALLAAYNCWGKRCPLPPLTDGLQGLGWAALIGYGAAATGREPTQRTALLATYELLLIVMVNGVHGALRDLENDQARGAHTTAILLGARVDGAGRIVLTPAMGSYAAMLQAALLALPAWAAADLAKHNPRGRAATLGAVAAVEAATLAVLALAARRGASTEAGMAHLVLLLTAPLAVVVPGQPGGSRLALLAAHLVPLLSNGLTYDALRWLTSPGRAGASAA